jgi:hypothetical protein
MYQHGVSFDFVPLNWFLVRGWEDNIKIDFEGIWYGLASTGCG